MELFFAADPAKYQQIRDHIASNRKTIDGALRTLDRLVATPQEKALLARSVIHPISEAVGVAQTVAHGGLHLHIDTTRADKPGELMRALKHMHDSLHGIVKNNADAARTAAQLVDAASDVAVGGGGAGRRAGQGLLGGGGRSARAGPAQRPGSARDQEPGDGVSQVRNVTKLVNGISLASHEQATGIHQVGAAVSQLDQVTQQNAALVEQSAAAAESLAEHAQHLVRAVGLFKLSAAA